MKILNSKKASGYIDAAIYTVVISMILSVILLYASIITIVQTTKNDTRRVLDSFIMQNSIEIYDSIKNGNDFTEEIDEDSFTSSIIYSLSLDKSENAIYAYDSSGTVTYIMTNPNVTYTTDNTLKLKAEYTLKIPVQFAGIKLFDLVIPQGVKSSYTLK